MTGTRRLEVERTALLTLLLAAALVLAALPLAGTARAQDAEDEIQGDVLHREADDEAGLIASTRFAGQQRFATAALIATETWEQSDRVIIAQHDDWPDALSGGYLSGVFQAPVLLVSTNDIQPDTTAALNRLGATEVTLLGGTSAISQANEDRLSEDYEVDRVWGQTRFETAAEVATEGGTVGEIDGRRTAIVATGIEFADALTMGPLAYSGQFPILLTPSQSLHPATEEALRDLEIEHVLLAGGTSAISADVEEEIREAIEGDEDSVVRLRGETRVETAADVAEFALAELDFTTFEHGWARGNEFADALTVGPRLGELNAPLLLVPTPTRLDSGQGTNAAFAEEHACETSRIDIAGGTAAVSEEVEDGLRELFACPGEAINVELSTDEESVSMGEDIEVTATVTDNLGQPVEGATVEFDAESLSATPVFADESVDTDADGQATTTVTSPTPGEALLIGAVTRDDHVFAGLAEVEWTLPGMTSMFELELSSAQEPGDAGDLDPEVTGRAVLFLNSDDGAICWGIEVDPTEHEIGSFENFALPENAHVHEETTGDIVVPLGQVDDDTQTDAGCDDTVDPADLADIEADPAGYYVNVHTTEFPGGVVRGQLELEAGE